MLNADEVRAVAELEKVREPDSPLLWVILDLSTLTMGLLTPKAGIITSLTRFFVEMAPVSDRVVRAVALVVGSPVVAAAIDTGLNTFPGGVPTRVVSEMVEAKVWLKAQRKTK